MNKNYIIFKKLFAGFVCLTICSFINVHSINAHSESKLCADPTTCSIASNTMAYAKNQNELEEIVFSKMLSLETEFKVDFDNNMNINDVKNAFKNVVSKPEIIEVYKSYKINVLQNSMNVKVKYNTNSSMEKKLNDYVKNWVNKNIHSTMKDEEKVRAIHNFMVTNFKYNFGDKNSKSGEYLIYTPSSLVYGDGGVCQAYSSLFYKIAVKSGLQAELIGGYSKNQYYEGNHSWNLVKVDGSWYHIDVTWDDPISDNSNTIRYDYYLKSDEYMSKSHNWNKSKYPAAIKNYN